MKFKAQILDELAVKRAMTRISFEVVERVNLNNAVLVGIKTRGVFLAQTIRENIMASSGIDLSFLLANLYLFPNFHKSALQIEFIMLLLV